jgi:hypothetical protein
MSICFRFTVLNYASMCTKFVVKKNLFFQNSMIHRSKLLRRQIDVVCLERQGPLEGRGTGREAVQATSVRSYDWQVPLGHGKIRRSEHTGVGNLIQYITAFLNRWGGCEGVYCIYECVRFDYFSILLLMSVRPHC